MVSAKLKSGRAAVSGLPKDRQKAMDEALSQVEKQFGKGAIMRLGENHVVDVRALSPGSGAARGGAADHRHRRG